MFDRSRLKVQPLSKRVSDLDHSVILPLDAPISPFAHPAIPVLAQKLRTAKEKGAARILFIGAHVIRAGVQRFLIDMMEDGLIDHIAMNGGAAIHDYELSTYGVTTESVARYIKDGQFGLWDSMYELNNIVKFQEDGSLGCTIGAELSLRDDTSETSILAAAFIADVRPTVHIGIGCDIVCELPNYDAAKWAMQSYEDFLLLASTMERLEGGVLINAGSAVFGPEVCLKALAMAQNVAHQEGRKIEDFTTAVLDLQPLLGTTSCDNTVDPSDANYFNRAYKSFCCRAVTDKGRSFYVQGDHSDTIPALWRACKDCP